jgi:hypothetical protein
MDFFDYPFVIHTESSALVPAVAKRPSKQTDLHIWYVHHIAAKQKFVGWPAAGSTDTELGVFMELEVGHGETEIYAGVQA